MKILKSQRTAGLIVFLCLTIPSLGLGAAKSTTQEPKGHKLRVKPDLKVKEFSVARRGTTEAGEQRINLRIVVTNAVPDTCARNFTIKVIRSDRSSDDEYILERDISSLCSDTRTSKIRNTVEIRSTDIVPERTLPSYTVIVDEENSVSELYENNNSAISR